MRVKLREIVWALIFFADRGADERSSCGLVLAAIIVAFGVLAMVALGQAILPALLR